MRTQATLKAHGLTDRDGEAGRAVAQPGCRDADGAIGIARAPIFVVRRGAAVESLDLLCWFRAPLPRAVRADAGSGGAGIGGGGPARVGAALRRRSSTGVGGSARLRPSAGG